MAQYICFEAILVMLFCFIGVCIVGLFRNNWTCKVQMAWSELVGEYTRHLIDTRQGYSVERHSQFYQAIWSYDKMLQHFLIWDRDKMVNDRGRYSEIMQFHKGKILKFNT